MANPIKAVKALGRAVGGITGKGSKQINPVYKNMGLSKAEARANKRGLKAANKPVSKNNRNRLGDGEMFAYLKNTPPARPNRIRGER